MCAFVRRVPPFSSRDSRGSHPLPAICQFEERYIIRVELEGEASQLANGYAAELYDSKATGQWSKCHLRRMANANSEVFHSAAILLGVVNK